MNNANKKYSGWKQKVVLELIDYFINFIYLAVFFGVFAWYRRLILAEYQIAYLNFGVPLIEALILAKVIMLGDILRFHRRLEGRPLIFPTLYNTVVFTVWVLLFILLEHTVRGLLHGKGVMEGFEEIVGLGRYEILARLMIVFLAFIPFFAIRELGGVLGEGKLLELFFRRRTATESDLPSRSTPHSST